MTIYGTESDIEILERDSSTVKLDDLFWMNMIFGRPGTGKTTAIENLVEEYLANGGDRQKIYYLTYSRNMAEKARERLGKNSTNELSENNVGTFHSILSRIIGWHVDFNSDNSDYLSDNDIAEFAERWAISKRILSTSWDNEIEAVDEWTRFSLACDVKINSMDTRAVSDFYPNTKYDIDYVFEDYQKYKKELKKHDFTDILVTALEVDLPECDLLFIDEAQDLTPLMWRIVDSWAEKAKKVVVVGDDMQSIYTFRGADPDLFLDRRNESRVIHLTKSYRMPAAVKELTDGISRAVYSKELVRFEDSGKPGYVVRTTLEDFVGFPGEKWILCRTNWTAWMVGSNLNRLGIVYLPLNERHAALSPWNEELIEVVNSLNEWPFLTPKPAEALIKRLPAKLLTRGLKTRVINGDIEEVIKELSGGIFGKFDATLLFRQNIRASINVEELIRQLDASQKVKELMTNHIGRPIIKELIVRLDTIHAAKGLEAERVALITNLTKKVRRNMISNPDDENKIFYVGTTRATRTLALINAYLTPEVYDV